METNNLNSKQSKFCREYVQNGLNATQAYMKVYKSCKKESSARSRASKLLTNVNVQAYLSELTKKVEEKAEITVKDVVDELVAIAFADRTKITKVNTVNKKGEDGKSYKEQFVFIADTENLDEDIKKTIASYKKTKNGIAVETFDKMKALELLGKYFGMFKENFTFNNPEATKVLKSINSQLKKRNK